MSEAVRPRETTKRSADELRTLSMEWGGLSRADGSARFGFGPDRAVASVSGPIEVRMASELPNKATLEVNVRRLAGLPATTEKQQSKDFRDILEQILILSQYPRTLIQLVVQSLALVSIPHWNRPSYLPPETKSDRHQTANPSLIAAGINATSLAFLNAASVAMRGTLCAVAVGKQTSSSTWTRDGPKTALVLDPEEAECEGGWGVFAFVFGETFDSGAESIWVDCVGLYDEKEFKAASELARRGATHVLQYFRTELSSRANGVKPKTENAMDLS